MTTPSGSLLCSLLPPRFQPSQSLLHVRNIRIPPFGRIIRQLNPRRLLSEKHVSLGPWHLFPDDTPIIDRPRHDAQMLRLKVVCHAHARAAAWAEAADADLAGPPEGGRHRPGDGARREVGEALVRASRELPALGAVAVDDGVREAGAGVLDVLAGAAAGEDDWV